MLDGFALGQAISDHSGVECYPAMREDSEKRYIVKKISLPASQDQVEAFLLTGVYKSRESAALYYKGLAEDLREEIQILERLAQQRGFVPYSDHQIEAMEHGVGYEVHMLSRYRKTLDRYLLRNPMTQLGAVNLGIDMCAALAVCREMGWLYVDLKPENIFLFGDQEYRIGDLGFVSMDALAYKPLAERYRSLYTAPEVVDAYSRLNPTMDTYALGLILYQVYNEGKLPFTDADSRKEWLEGLKAGKPMDAPRCADQEMSEIILKACAYDPIDRWQTPAEMGHALIRYMQTRGADDIPLVPPVVEEIPGEKPVEESQVEEAPLEEAPAEHVVEEVPAEEAVAEETPAEESVPAETVAEEPAEESTPEEEPIVEDPPVEEPVEETPAEEPAEAATVEESIPEEPVVEETEADWIDLMDSILANDGPTGIPEEEDEPSLRDLLGDTEEMAEHVVLDEEEVSAETADMLSFAQDLIDHEAPAPVVVPEPIDVPIPEPIRLEEDEDAPLEVELPEEEPAEESEPETPAEAPVPPEAEKKPGIWKKLLSAVAALALVAGLAFGGWYYYQNYYLQTIDTMECVGSGTQVTVNVATAMDMSQLTVICKDTYGNAVQGQLENGTVTFSDLVPGSQYIITLEPKGFNKLVGKTSVTYSTPAETQLMHLTAVTGQEAGSAIVSFGVEGTDSDSWMLTYSAEGLEPVTVTFEGHTVTVPALTVGTEYTFTVTAPEGVLLVGENTVKHVASDLVQARNLALKDYADGTITVVWNAPEGVAVERWIARCYDGAGYDQLVEVTDTTASFQNITEGNKYTVEVTAATMTLGIRTEITADSNNISGFAAALNGSAIDLSWNYPGAIPENGWQIAWSANGGPQQMLTATENKATLSPAVPGASYTFTIQPPEGTALLAATATVDVEAAGAFEANKLNAESIIVEMYQVPGKSNWNYGTLQRSRESDTFKPGDSLALLYTVTKPYSYDKSEFTTVFAICDAEGKLVDASARTRVWDDMWDNGYCTETVKNLPAQAGSYTLTVYVGGGKLAELPFTIK